ncbi:MAG: acetate kinase [Eubacteriales bacterium]|nr:acetate kinase [Eubacteriales bacterium]MDD4475458.1 acetate kinase [Eubacteriales bacterium]
MYVLVINAGSSSLKYQLFDMANEVVLAKGLCDRIAIDGILTHQTYGKEKYSKEIAMPNHTKAIQAVLKILCDNEFGCIDDLSQIVACGHRIVHGGEWLTKSVLVDEKVIGDLEKCRAIAPLHTGPHLMGLRGCMENMPDTPQVLVIDTAFHQTMPAHAYFYPIPYELYEKYKIRRYGFHGTSHRYVSAKAIEYLGKPAVDTKIITCHLGNGSSISAIKGGKVIDTSMGFTPLEGIIMGSRCGNIDPAIVPFLMEKENISASEMGVWLNKKCGFLGVSGVSSDLRDIDTAIEEGNERAKLAYEILSYDIKKYIGTYMAVLGGLDAIVFTAGIGENNKSVRFDSLQGLESFGIKVDANKNDNFRNIPDPVEISADDSKVKIYVIPTNEELVIARDTIELVKNVK